VVVVLAVASVPAKDNSIVGLTNFQAPELSEILIEVVK
jgi:hypothetical protein